MYCTVVTMRKLINAQMQTGEVLVDAVPTHTSDIITVPLCTVLYCTLGEKDCVEKEEWTRREQNTLSVPSRGWRSGRGQGRSSLACFSTNDRFLCRRDQCHE